MTLSKQKQQIHKFTEKARELECSEDEAVFEDRLRQIAQSPPQKANKEDQAPDK